jgi:hypothetical protein
VDHVDLVEDAARLVALVVAVGALPFLMDWLEHRATRPVDSLRRDADRARRTSAHEEP